MKPPAGRGRYGPTCGASGPAAVRQADTDPVDGYVMSAGHGHSVGPVGRYSFVAAIASPSASMAWRDICAAPLRWNRTPAADYTELTGRFVEVEMRVEYEGRVVRTRMEMEDGYPLMKVVDVED